MANHTPLLYVIVLLLATVGIMGRPDKFSTLRRRGRHSLLHTDAQNWSNAVLLARGLPPRKPRAFFSPTRIAREPQPSVLPGPITYSGKLKVVQRASGGKEGYVSTDFTPEHGFGLTNTASKVMEVQFTHAASGPFDIAITSPSTHPNLGFAGNLVSGTSIATCTATNQSQLILPRVGKWLATSSDLYINHYIALAPAGSVPSIVGNSNSLIQESESAIWTFDPSTRKLTASWINADTSQFF
ncbi:hypothetical protein D9611_006269 [Ephemerocybe angulata]|uniref:Uncharacterized protein n=1 Tax=Ephemerocybe angulata TaxID=980116 RepID=A0A8H5C6V5_9AGAR|nr:hypothetical protein D9611_006269 [Tulosesus angulatus]